MIKKKHSNLTSTYTETFVLFFPSFCSTSAPNVELILLLLLMWKNVYCAWIVVQTQATWKTMNVFSETHTQEKVSQFGCLLNFVSHWCIKMTPCVMPYLLVASNAQQLWVRHLKGTEGEFSLITWDRFYVFLFSHVVMEPMKPDFFLKITQKS